VTLVILDTIPLDAEIEPLESSLDKIGSEVVLKSELFVKFNSSSEEVYLQNKNPYSFL
jgi:hypothetical protein